MKQILPAASFRGMTRFGLLAVGVLALAAMGCGDQSVGPDSSSDLSDSAVIDDATITAVGAEATAATVDMMNGHGVPRLLAGRLPGRVPDGCPYDAASGRFVCPDNNVDDGRDVSRSYAFLDALGNTQAAYDEVSTAAINFQTEVVESHTGPRGGSHTAEHQRNLTASGLEGAETSWIWNGSGSGTAHREGPPPTERRRGGPGGPGEGNGNGRPGGNGPGQGNVVNVTVDMTMSSTINSVVVPMPRVEGSWPLSGSITKTITATFTGGPKDGQTVTRTITITFDGTQYASLNDGTETISIDLANHGRRHNRGHR